MNSKPRSTNKSYDNPSIHYAPDSYYFKLMKVASSQICKDAGYTSGNESALATLTRIGVLYLKTLARRAAQHSNSEGRTESNLLDVVNAIKDISPSTANLNEIIEFVEISKEIPFAQPVPRSEGLGVGFVLGKETLNACYVPTWLPGFAEAQEQSAELPTICNRELWEEGEVNKGVDFRLGNEMDNLFVPSDLPVDRNKIVIQNRFRSIRGRKRAFDLGL